MNASANRPTAISRARATEDLAGARVLMVDDDAGLRRVVALTLAELGCRVHQIASGVDLTRVVETITERAWPNEGLDLILIDLKMPGVDGIEALRVLREAGDSTPALLLTAFPEPEVRARAAALGVPVLAKPFRLSALVNRVAELASGLGQQMIAIPGRGWSTAAAGEPDDD